MEDRVYACHVFGVTLNNLWLNIRNGSDVFDYDIIQDIYEHPEFIDRGNCEGVQIVPFSETEFAIGFPVNLPWEMPVTDKTVMIERIQDFLKKIADENEIPADFAQRFSHEIFECWREID